MTDLPVEGSWDKLEAMLREAFQAGQQHGLIVSGNAVPLNEGPHNEDDYIRRAKQKFITDYVIGLGEATLATHHSALADSLLRKEAEASSRLDGETHVVEDTNG